MATTRRSIVPRLCYLSTLLLLALLLQCPPLVHPSTEVFIEEQLRQNRYLGSICFPSAGGLSLTYSQNLENLFRSLVDSIPATGYNYTSLGQPPNTVYGFAQCRGDLPADICQNCTTTAVERVKAECPRNSSAIIWFEGCFLRFSNKSFFRTLERSIHMCIPWADPSSELSTESGGLELVSELVREAASSPKLYATMIKPKEGYISYSLAQCTIDLSPLDCHRCFQDAIQVMRTNHSLGRVWRFVSPSCVILHYAWPFFLTSPTLTTDPAKSKNGNQMIRLVIIMWSIVGILLLAMGITVLYFHRLKRKQLNEKLREYNTEIVPLGNLAVDEGNHELPQYSLRAAQAATTNFSEENKLIRGEFGLVYKRLR